MEVTRITMGNDNIERGPVSAIVEFSTGSAKAVATLLTVRKPQGRSRVVPWAISVVTNAGATDSYTLEAVWGGADAEREVKSVLGRFVTFAAYLEPAQPAPMTKATDLPRPAERIPGVVGVL